MLRRPFLHTICFCAANCCILMPLILIYTATELEYYLFSCFTEWVLLTIKKLCEVMLFVDCFMIMTDPVRFELTPDSIPRDVLNFYRTFPDRPIDCVWDIRNSIVNRVCLFHLMLRVVLWEQRLNPQQCNIIIATSLTSPLIVGVSLCKCIFIFLLNFFITRAQITIPTPLLPNRKAHVISCTLFLLFKLSTLSTFYLCVLHSLVYHSYSSSIRIVRGCVRLIMWYMYHLTGVTQCHQLYGQQAD